MRSPEEEANLRLVQRVYDEVLGPIDSSAVDAIFDLGYIQHNPNVETGSQALKEMLDRAKQRHPETRHLVKRLLVDGALVAAHVHVIFEPGTEGFAVVDIFRISGDKIVEHWDVMQTIVPSDKNANGRF